MDSAQEEDNRIKHLQKIDVYQDDLHGELAWLRDNDYLIRGYRKPISFMDAIRRYCLVFISNVVYSVVIMRP